MATTNQERIGRGLLLLAKGLEPRVVKALQAAYGASWWDVVDQQAEAATGRGVGTSTADPHFLLTTMWHHWNAVFGKVLGKAERTYVSELQDIRNRWAHPKPDRPFTLDETDRALGTMRLLLAAIGAPDEASEVDGIRQEVLRQRFEAEAKRETKRAATAAVTSEPVAGLRPWRTIIEPHPDVAAGRYLQAEFAADLGQVARGAGSAEYVDPRLFFERTYLTAGLHDLLGGALERVAGKGGEPVIELQTNFGGGKTHSMLALYHLFSGAHVSQMAGVEPIIRSSAHDQLPDVRRIVLVGTALSAAEPRVHDGTEIRTLWGELAWQLGGTEAFERLARADAGGVSPGSDILRQLFDDFGPALILIDEWVTFVRQLWTDSSLPGGSFDSNLSFAQSLTEAVRQTSNSLLVASLPSSDIETGGEGGRTALTRLKNTFGRIQSPWRPADAQESFKIVQSRLFQPIPAEHFAARDAVIQAFVDVYARNAGDFPPETKEASYQRRMTDAYPIHPELFERLYEDWSSLERFQRTRGVLRLMAAVIHSLWESGDQSPLILSASVQIADGRVQRELTRYLEENWVPVIERDVDGPSSVPFEIDSENKRFGQVLATRRVARTVFLGSAPTADAPNRGLEDRRIKLGCMQPGESVAVFGDALRHLSNRATHLYDNQGRYWFSTQESVAQLARDRAGKFTDEVLDEIRRRVRDEQADRGPFVRVHIAPRTAAEVADEDEVALVVLGPEAPHTTRSEQSPALSAADTLLNDRGTGPRQHRNMLLFLASDQTRLAELEEAIRQYMAWKSIEDDLPTLTLDSFQERQVRTKVSEANETVAVRLPEAYQWLIVPEQPDPNGQVSWRSTRLSGADRLVPRAGRKLTGEDLLLTKMSGTYLRLQLDRVPAIWEGGEVSLRQLWSYFTAYLYMPRLRNISVLLEAIADGAGLMWHENFAYAAGKDSSGRYLGLSVGRQADVVLDAHSLLVRPELAAAQLERERDEAEREKGKEAEAPAAGDKGRVITEPTAKVARRFYGSLELDPSRPTPQFSQVADEVISRLAGLADVDVKVRVDIEAVSNGEGFSDATVRTVTENAKTLRFSNAGFEEE
jgi:predicted AAA+ superfamily ATPase